MGDTGEKTLRRVAVIGGGVGGLAVAHLLLTRGIADVKLFEASSRLGGNVTTWNHGGAAIDAGPDALVVSKPEVKALCDAIGMTESLRAPKGPPRTMVGEGRRLFALPEGLLGGVPRSLREVAMTPLVSFGGKARALLDLVKGETPPERASVGEIIDHRLGREVKERLVEPLFAAIYGGDVDRLDAATVAPMLDESRRGLLRGLRKGQPPPIMRTPAEGMVTFVDALARSIGHERIVTRAPLRALEERQIGWDLTIGDAKGEHRESFDDVVLAVPPPAAARALESVDRELAESLSQIEMGSTVCVLLVFPARDGDDPLPLGGLVISRGEGCSLRAATVVSDRWPGRSPDGQIVIRAMLGGAGRPELPPDASDEEIALRAWDELRRFVDLPAPSAFGVTRFSRALTVPTVDLREQLVAIEARLARHRGLYLAGASYGSPGLAGCVARAERIAAAM